MKTSQSKLGRKKFKLHAFIISRRDSGQTVNSLSVRVTNQTLSPPELTDQKMFTLFAQIFCLTSTDSPPFGSTSDHFLSPSKFFFQLTIPVNALCYVGPAVSIIE